MKKLEEYEPSSGILQKNVLKQLRLSAPLNYVLLQAPVCPPSRFVQAQYIICCAPKFKTFFSYLYFFSWPALHRQYIDNIASFTASQFVSLSGKLIE